MFQLKLQIDGVNTTSSTSNLGFLSSPFHFPSWDSELLETSGDMEQNSVRFLKLYLK